MKTNEIVAGGSYEAQYVISSGSYLFDQILRYKGFPSGAMVHLFSSQEGSFKTSLALMGLVNHQERGHNVGFVDAEKSLDINWANDIGIKDDDSWFYSMPTNGENALEHVETMLKEHDCKGIILDSADACQPANYMESEYGDSIMMQHAKLMNKFARRVSGLVKEYDAIVYVVNQMRTAGGSHMTYNKASGGKGLPFYSTINVEMKKTDSKSKLVGKDQVPIQIRVRRSKMGRSWRDVDTYGLQGMAIDNEAELIEVAKQAGLMKRSGTWYKARNEDDEWDNLGQHISTAKKWINDNREKVLSHL